MHRSAAEHCKGVKINTVIKKGQSQNGSVLFVNYSEFISNPGKEEIVIDKANNVNIDNDAEYISLECGEVIYDAIKNYDESMK